MVIESLERNLVLDGPYLNRDFYNFVNTSELPRHRWYYFKEGFSVELIKEAILASRSKNIRMLDPFNGSGTTILTSALNKVSSIGIEVNPFLEFVSKVKTDSISINEQSLKEIMDSIVIKSKESSYSNFEGQSTFTEREGLEKWIFNTGVVRRYSGILRELNKFENCEYHDVIRFAALKALMECSNTKKDGKGIRYKKNWKDLCYTGSNLESHFTHAVNLIASDCKNTEIIEAYKPALYHGDSRLLLNSNEFTEEGIDLVVTSPPYLNSFDYTDIYRPELFLGGFVKSNHELNELRKKTLRSHVQVTWDSSSIYNSEMIDFFVNQVSKNAGNLWSKRIPQMIREYFGDMNSVLKGIYNRLNKGGEIWLVVSTSAYAGIHIPVDLIIAQVGNDLGYKLKAIHCLRYMRTSSQQYSQLGVAHAPLRESLIILKK